MGLFGKKNVFLGIDFGTSSIKAVEVAFKNQRPELVNYGHVQMPEGADPGAALKVLLKRMNPSTKNAYVALPGSSGLVTLIAFPKMSEAELAQAVSFEARKHIPIPLDQVSVSWDVVAQDNAPVEAGAKKIEQDAGKLYVLLVAAPVKNVEQHEAYLASTNLNLSALELETFSLTRAMVGEDMGRFLLADIGLQATNIIFVEKGVIRANRNVGVGGANITKAIAEAMNIDEARAEAYKYERDDLLSDGGMACSAVDMIVEEIRRVGTAGGQMTDNVIITGGASNLQGIDTYMARALGVNVTRGNPWARVTVPEEVQAFLAQTHGAFSVAVGLALRGVEEYRRS